MTITGGNPVLGLVLIGALALAGCLASSTPGTEPTAEQQAADTDATVRLADCHQQHLAFTGLIEDFEPSVPDGFTIVPEDSAGLTTTLLIIASRCPTATLPDHQELTEVHDVVLELHVQPPAELDDALADVLVIERYVSHEAIATTLQEAGLAASLETAAISLSHTATPAALTTALTVEGDTRAYAVDTVLSAAEGLFEASQVRAWFAGEDGQVAGSLVRSSSQADNLGLGTVAFQATGEGGAPPVTAGAAHEVTGLTMELLLSGVAP